MRDPLGEAADRSDKTDRMEREPGGEAAILLRDRPGGAACGGRAGAISRRPDMRLDGGSVRPRLSTKNSKRNDEAACEACVFTWRTPLFRATCSACGSARDVRARFVLPEDQVKFRWRPTDEAWGNPWVGLARLGLADSRWRQQSRPEMLALRLRLVMKVGVNSGRVGDRGLLPMASIELRQMMQVARATGSRGTVQAEGAPR